MALPSINPTHTKAWTALEQHFNHIQQQHLRDLFKENPKRAEEFSVIWEDFYVDFSKNRIDATTKSLLLQLAEEVKLKEAIQYYFDGERINQTENRAVLHTALRMPEDAQVFVDGKNVIPEIYEVKDKIKTFCDEVISGKRTGYTNK